ncbi:MAG: FAD:protein FMN transferase [Planctomycetales bacterium]|nr:FAD:protein FMN transferase [Planctomycetales bacterium]
MTDQEPTSRRDFLRGKSAFRALLGRTRQAVDAVADSLQHARTLSERAATADAPAARLCISRRAMACTFSREYHAVDSDVADDAALAALDLIERLEDQLSVYRAETEVQRINADAATEAVPVEAGLFNLLTLSQRIAEDTNGAFDITSGPLAKAWGFFSREGRMPDETDLADALRRVDWRRVILDAAAQTVRFASPEVEIQFNSIGKGYALDCAKRSMAEAAAADFLLQGGGSSVVACGNQRGSAANGWLVGIPHPSHPERRLGQIVLRNAGLGTSGSGVQGFVHEGQRYGHVIDPRTGRPANGLIAATAVAPTGAEADALATAFYVMGPGDTAEYCHAHPNHGAVLVCEGGEDAAYDVHVFNLIEGRQWLPERGTNA